MTLIYRCTLWCICFAITSWISPGSPRQAGCLISATPTNLSEAQSKAAGSNKSVLLLLRYTYERLLLTLSFSAHQIFVKGLFLTRVTWLHSVFVYTFSSRVKTPSSGESWEEAQMPRGLCQEEHLLLNSSKSHMQSYLLSQPRVNQVAAESSTFSDK